MGSLVRLLDKVRGLAQTGLAYTKDPFDRERYQSLQEITAELVSRFSGESPEKMHAIISKDEGYATPKVDVRGVIFRNDEILLVRERSEGLWTVPGGWADIGETPSECVVKEIYEE